MKKLILLFVSLFLACAFLCAADVALHGYLTAQYKFEFAEDEDPTHTYGIEGSVFGVTIELNKLSLNRPVRLQGFHGLLHRGFLM